MSEELRPPAVWDHHPWHWVAKDGQKPQVWVWSPKGGHAKGPRWLYFVELAESPGELVVDGYYSGWSEMSGAEEAYRDGWRYVAPVRFVASLEAENACIIKALSDFNLFVNYDFMPDGTVVRTPARSDSFPRKAMR